MCGKMKSNNYSMREHASITHSVQHTKQLRLHFKGRNFQTVLAIIGVLVVLLSVSAEGKRKTWNCTVCKTIVTNFKKALESTAKSNYGGGNTHWEERALGSYEFSEIRLTEIIDNLCESSNNECHTMLEEHEELIEHFWFKKYANNKDTDLLIFLCIDNMKACCPNNTYGSDCLPCKGGQDQPCNGNGKCEGEGTRTGSGKCLCHSGYQGELCDLCKDGYFQSEEDSTKVVCKVCDISCKNTCSEGGAQGCDECKDGWVQDDDKGCLDVNECSEDPCEEKQYCVNTQGSYTCFTCDSACVSCTGSGPGKCNECSEGFSLIEETSTCEDKDECAQDASLCSRENEVCENTRGSYECNCKSGFYRKEDVCVPVPEETEAATDLDEKPEEPAADEPASEDNIEKEEL